MRECKELLLCEEKQSLVATPGAKLRHQLEGLKKLRPKEPSSLVATILIGLAVLEVLSFSIGGIFSILGGYTWGLLGLFTFSYLAYGYLVSLASDAKKLSFWGLVPLIAGIPLIFWNIRGYAFLNTESLSELQHALEQLRRPDLGYTQMFWFSYPSRSLLIALIPTLFGGASPEAYRLGFSLPMFLGVLFLYTGIRRYHNSHPLSATIAALSSSAIFAFPMLVQFVRTFEMATSSTSFGLWAVAAVLLFAARPSFVTALSCGWCLGLVPASFTSGLALAALLWATLSIWAVYALIQRNSRLALMLASIVSYGLVIGIAFYLQHPRLLQSQTIKLSQMLAHFYDGMKIMVSFAEPSFIPRMLVIPVVWAVIWAVLLRGGVLLMIAAAWCFPVIWSAVNMQGKIAPQLPFCLYRALIVIPILVIISAELLYSITARAKRPLIKLGGGLVCLAITLGLAWTSIDLYRQQLVLVPMRQALGRESVMERLVYIVKLEGLTQSTNGVLVNRLEDNIVENFLGCAQYLLHGWQRVNETEPLSTLDSSNRRPIVIVTNEGNPILFENMGAFRQSLHRVSIARHERPDTTVIIVVLHPV